jgi:excinuclease ABC subunit A
VKRSSQARGAITIQGAREHNLKNLNLTIPRDALVVVTGVSGSGKSSLAFDTIYAEGQRRYVESLSAYARQFLGQMSKPQVDHIEGLSPAIAIDQRAGRHNPRSTVATITEIYDYLRVLFARIGEAHCPDCGIPVGAQSIDEIIRQILTRYKDQRVMILSPLVRDRKGEYRKEMAAMLKAGFMRARVDGEVVSLESPPKLKKTQKHSIEIVVDRMRVEDKRRSRLVDSIETALDLANGSLMISGGDGRDVLFSERAACLQCGRSFPELHPRNFSFNSPHGACSRCHGIGVIQEVDPGLLIVDPGSSIMGGAMVALQGSPTGWLGHTLKALGEKFKFDPGLPWNELPESAQQILLYGSKGEQFQVKVETKRGKYEGQISYEGLIPTLERRYRDTKSTGVRESVARLIAPHACPECGGGRLRAESLAVKAGGYHIHEWIGLDVVTALGEVNKLCHDKRSQTVTVQVRKEIRDRLGFLNNVGLGYLTLDRGASTLSSGEMQRIRLATQIGSQLVGVLYVLDEPSIGLHHRDNQRLLAAMQKLRDLGNTVLVVEHDEETILAADHVIDLGPGAGRLGGEITAQGTPKQISRAKKSLTGAYLRGEKFIPVPRQRRQGTGNFIEVIGAREHNLKNVTATFPLGTLTCVTGVSGSGKSTLVNEILHASLARSLNRASLIAGDHDEIKGVKYLDKVIGINQAPIGRTPRSNPATYTGAFSFIRDLYAKVTEARIRGYKAGRFSFNVKGGRCESCRGDGMVKIEMHFLPDVYVTCEVCNGRRYNQETLEITYKGKSIYDVLAMTVDDASAFFTNIPGLNRKITTLKDVGLGYLRLGQQATTLSGGEAQRVKLASELSKVATGRTLYFLDEPTTGLHFEDVRILLIVLNRLVEAGNTVVIIEHNLDVIKNADWIVDLGPEGGEAGGQIVAAGPPEAVAKVKGSWTGKALATALKSNAKIDLAGPE